MKKMGQDEFIARASKLWKNKFDYSNVVYVNARTKVKIICPEHGTFNQLPVGHLQGKDCAKCAKKIQENWVNS